MSEETERRCRHAIAKLDGSLVVGPGIEIKFDRSPCEVCGTKLAGARIKLFLVEE